MISFKLSISGLGNSSKINRVCLVLSFLFFFCSITHPPVLLGDHCLESDGELTLVLLEPQKADYVKKALKGDAVAAYELGCAHNLPGEYHKSARFYQISAKLGDAAAQYMLGRMYLSGKGVSQDSKKAYRWIRISAENGLARARYFLGVLFAEGVHVHKDIVLSYMWLTLVKEGFLDPTTRDNTAEALRVIPRHMTSKQIAKGKRLAREWKPVKKLYEYVIRSGDTLSLLSELKGVPLQFLQLTNSIVGPELQLGQKIFLPSPDFFPWNNIWTVRKGQTLHSIGKVIGIPLEMVKEKNVLRSDKIKVGQKLKIPFVTFTANPLWVDHKPVTVANGKILLNGNVVFDVNSKEIIEKLGCSKIIKVDYSQNMKQFMALLQCYENDNHLLLFDSVTGENKLVTSECDTVRGENVAWGGDSNSIVYCRQIPDICFSDQKREIEDGLVSMNTTTKEKTDFGLGNGLMISGIPRGYGLITRMGPGYHHTIQNEYLINGSGRIKETSILKDTKSKEWNLIFHNYCSLSWVRSKYLEKKHY